ncbi:hypothetical protein BGZ72_002636 [Mortierella alpina]|nr:hypothetical protein BGZ72_002636 [Mortierella alpina]
MVKTVTLVWWAIVAMTIVHSAPSGARSELTNLENRGFGQPLLMETTDSNDALRVSLRERFESEVGNITFKSYALILTNQWQVWKLDRCQAKIRAPKPIGTALYCDRASPSSCQLSVKFINTQTVAIQDGVTAEFSLSLSAGEPGIFEAKISTSVSRSRTVTRTYGKSTEFMYTATVGAGKMCTPSIVSYYLSCQGTHWVVNNDPSSKPCSEIQTRFKIDFEDSHRWFVDPKNDEWFQYVHEDRVHGDQLWSFHVKFKAPPASCDDIVQIVDMRTLSNKRNRTTSEAFLRLDDGQTLSAVSCVYPKTELSKE